MVGSTLLAVAVTSGTTAAVETDIAISTSAIDFGSVEIGSSASVPVIVTNTGGDPFGPINMFGGAPPTDEFGASQNCQGNTLPPGGSCQVNYEFSPASAGTFTDTSNFTISETASQGDGEDFSVALAGVGVDPTATTTAPTTSTSTTTTTAVTTTTAEPTDATTTDATEPVATEASTTSTSAPTVWPLTGTGVVGRPAIAVSIDNVDAAPQFGLNQADVVFEEGLGDGDTRFLAVFNATEPNPVGPIRPARASDLDLLSAFNDPALAHATDPATDEVARALDAAGFELLTDGDAGFFRHPGREEPQDLFANLSTLFAQLTTSGPAVAVFPYASADADPAGTPVTFVDLMVRDHDVAWTWDARQGLFLRAQRGASHELADGPASADNVVVLVVEYHETGETGPVAGTVGGGTAVVYTAGRRLDGTWTRPAPTAPFALTSETGPILLSPGRTWVELVDAQHELSDG